MSKQTATEWLFAHLLPFLEFSDPKEREYYRKCLAEAKAMEMEQIFHCYEQAYRDGYIDNGKAGQDYYNETYGGDK